ncbi:MAG: hypothetical protein ACJA0C_000568 [Candidatus Endobugula sp.]|jgi:hypothetical protein
MKGAVPVDFFIHMLTLLIVDLAIYPFQTICEFLIKPFCNAGLASVNAGRRHYLEFLTTITKSFI